MIRWKRSWPDLSEEMPIDVMPASNGEFVPLPPTDQQRQIMALQNQEGERVRRRLGMSRRDFVRSAAAYTVGIWAVNEITGGKWGRYALADNTATTRACDLVNDNVIDEATGLVTLANRPGEFIFDVQSHHVESDGMWRVTNPGFEAFFTAIWSQAGPLTSGENGRPGIRSDGSVKGFGAGEIDPIENLSRYHYLKELFLDSATTMTVLSAVPAAPDITQPLPIDRAVQTVEVVNSLSGSQRTVLHAFAMPNRGSAGTVASFAGREPVYMRAEFDTMEERAVKYGHLIRGWKTYPAWGDIPYASGWFFDDELVGQPFIEHVRYIGNKYGLPKNIATHKGFALPAFDQRAASPRDIGPAAKRNPDVNFIVYHSGYDSETMDAYERKTTGAPDTNRPDWGDQRVNSADRTVDSLIKSLRENNWDATRFAGANGFGNVPNVYAEIGSTWRSVMNNADAAAHLLGKLIRYVGPKRILWGTDSLWFGSPHSEIVMFRALQFTPAMNTYYGLADGLDSDVEDPTQPAPTPERTIRNAVFGRNAAAVYGVDPLPPLRPASGQVMDCDDVQKIRDAYILNQMTPRENIPLASNTIVGARTPRELWEQREGPWAP